MPNAEKEESVGFTLSENMRLLRKELSMSQEQLSERSGVPRSTIASLERGEGNPTLAVLMGIAQGFGVAIAALLAPRAPRATLHTQSSQTRVSYQRQSPQCDSPGDVVQILRLTPEQARYLVIEEVVLEGTEKIVSEAHAFGTEEYFFLVEGDCVIEVAQKTFSVTQGDLLRFDGDQIHTYCGSTPGQRARGFAVVVQVPRI